MARSVLISMLVTALLTVAGCSSPSSSSSPTSSSVAASAPAAVQAALAARGLEGRGVEQIIDRLDRSLDDGKGELMGSVRQEALVLTAGGEQFEMAMPTDKTYLSIAPYVDQTHDCFNHNLATCRGELADEKVSITVVDDAGKQLLSQQTTTYANGFVGIWLPRDITGTLTVEATGRKGSVRIGTGPKDPTCLTTLKLS